MIERAVSTLFRPEAIDGQRQSWLGEVRLARPLSLSVLTAFAVGVAALLVTFLFAGEYTRKAHLTGVLVPPAVGTSGTAVPAQGPLQAQLYAPPATIGLVRPHQPVMLRYEAFGWQQGAGRPSGRVVQVARTPSDAPECPGCAGSGANLAWYRVMVALDAQSVIADGQAQPLVVGMRVEAEIMLDRRKLVDWLFESAPNAAPGRG